VYKSDGSGPLQSLRATPSNARFHWISSRAHDEGLADHFGTFALTVDYETVSQKRVHALVGRFTERCLSQPTWSAGNVPDEGGSHRRTKRRIVMARYGRAASKSVKSAMRRRKHGTLRSGKGGKGGVVKSRKQAIAIGLSEARKNGAKVPRKQ
jgi:hypothetical protein